MTVLFSRPGSLQPTGGYWEVHVRQPDNHQCTPDCPHWPKPYTGPVLLGRRGEEVTR